MKIQKHLITYEKFSKGCTVFRYYYPSGDLYYKHEFLFYSIPECRKMFIEILKEQFKKA